MLEALPRIAALQAHFERVHKQQMQDVPILNPALWVETIGWQRWSNGILGVLITPWFMNLVWLPDVVEGQVATLDSLDLELPAGCYAMQRISSLPDDVAYACSLFSPVLEFTDHAAAVLTAQYVMLSLLDERMQASNKPAHQPPAPQVETSRSKSCSRRDFLRGKFV